MSVDEAQQLRVLSRRITAALVVVAVVAMVFTAVSVTTFALDHGVSPWVAWTLDPMVAVALLAVLLADARLVELGVAPSGWATALRWFAGLATWAMNAWQSVWPDGGFGVPRDVDAAGVVLHSVAPVLLVLLAEAATGYRRVIAARIRTLEGESAHPHLEVVVDDEGASWDEPWRAPFGDQETTRSIDPMQPQLTTTAAVAPAVARWSSTPVSDDHLDDQAHDHPGDQPDPPVTPVQAVVPVASEPVAYSPQDDHENGQADDQGPTDAELRKAARKLQRDALRTTRNPVTILTLQTELGLSRRRAAELRREVVGAAS